MSSCNDLQLVLDTVKHLNAQRAILHSDQGFQYTTKSYKRLLEEKQLIGSHSRRGNCFVTPAWSPFFSHLKTEKPYLEKQSKSNGGSKTDHGIYQLLQPRTFPE